MRLFRLLRYLILVVLAILLVAAAMANRGLVSVQALPKDVADFAGWNLVAEVPLFLVILVSAAFGIVIGFVWEWLREGKHRKEATTGKRHVNALAREVSRLRNEGGGRKDEVLALLDGSGSKR